MRTLGRFLAAICAVLFIISTALVLLLFNIERKAFSSATYKQAFEAQRLYERMPAFLATALTSSIAQMINPVPFLQALTIEDWQNMIRMLLPPEQLKAMTNNALDATFDYLNGRSSSVLISLQPLKAQLAGPSGLNVVMQILSLQPACTAEQLLLVAQGLLGNQFILCSPPPEAVGLMTSFIQSQLQNMTAPIPNEVTLIPGTLSSTPYDPRRVLNVVRSVIRFSPILPVLLLFGIALFAVRGLVDWFTWWGWPFFLAGYISTVVAMVGSPLVGGFLRVQILAQGTMIIPPVFAQALAETTSAVTLQLIAPAALHGFILGSVGLGMAILAMLLPRKPAGAYSLY
jgi:hypothetical protein